MATLPFSLHDAVRAEGRISPVQPDILPVPPPVTGRFTKKDKAPREPLNSGDGSHHAMTVGSKSGSKRLTPTVAEAIIRSGETGERNGHRIAEGDREPGRGSGARCRIPGCGRVYRPADRSRR